MMSLLKLFQETSSSKHLACVISLCVICFTAYHADNMTQKALLEDLEDDVTKELNLLKTQIEGKLNSNIQLVRGLVYTIKTEPDLNQTRFSELAEQLFHEDTLLSVVAGSPNLVNKVIYPFDKYKDLIGLDYKTKPELLKAALEAKNNNRVALAGPLDLKIGGGKGLIARFPITVDQSGLHTFWGIVSAVISIDKLIETSELERTSQSINVAIERTYQGDVTSNRFYGDQLLSEENAVVVEMTLPGSQWKFYAEPKAGWVVPNDILIYERILIGLLSFLLFVPVVIVSRYAEQKRQALNLLAKREEELANAYANAEYLSLHDHLTKLPNRRYLENYSDKLNTQKRYKGMPVTAFVLDLDHFKDINDHLGHAAGDDVLVHVAKVLKKQVRASDFVARIGGDEFIILSLNRGNENWTNEFCTRIISELKNPFYFSGQMNKIGVSIGVSFLEKNELSIRELIKKADQALYEAKENGRNNYRVIG